jgi:hypothetical protein
MPWVGAAMAVFYSAINKDNVDKISVLNNKLLGHFESLVKDIPAKWSIKDFTDSNRVQEMLIFLLSYNPTNVVLGPLSRFKASEMNQEFIIKCCRPIGIDAIDEKLCLSASRLEDETTWEYVKRMSSRAGTEVNRTLYGNNESGGQTTTNSVLQGGRALVKLPFQAVSNVVSSTLNGGSYLYDRVRNSMRSNNSSQDANAMQKNNLNDEFGDDNDNNDAKELDQSKIIVPTSPRSQKNTK